MTGIGVVACLVVLAASAQAGPIDAFKDRDESSRGALQDAHERVVVFAHAPISRNAKTATLVTKTTLDKPVYLRAYFPKTPARLVHERGYACAGNKHLAFILADATGKDLAVLARRPLEGYDEMRTSGISTPDGGKLELSIVPTKRVELSLQTPLPVITMLSIIAKLPIGDTELEVTARVVCVGVHGDGTQAQVVLAKGRIVFTVGAGDARRFAKRITPTVARGDAKTTARVRRLYAKLLPQQSKLVAFAADPTTVDGELRRTPIRAILKGADASCSLVDGRLLEDAGELELSTNFGYPMPCL